MLITSAGQKKCMIFWESTFQKRAKIVKEPGKVVGHIGKEVSEKSGLPVGTPICMGAHDQNCCTFGAGAVDDGTAVW